jgi:hypothetical protein
MNRDEIEQVPGMAELKNQSGELRHVKPAPSLAEQAMQAAAHAKEEAKNHEEEEYTYPSGKVKWEDTEEGWYQNEIKKINGGCIRDRYDAEQLEEFHKKFRPIVSGYSDEFSRYMANEMAASNQYGKKEYKPITDDEKGRPPRPSDRVEVRTAIWREEREKQRSQHSELIDIAQDLLEGRFLDRINNAIESEKNAIKELESHIDSTLALENKKDDDRSADQQC